MKDKIKQSVMELFETNSDYSFSELVLDLKNNGIDVNGDRALYLRKNLILWENTSSDFNVAMLELLEEEKLVAKLLSREKALIIYSYGGTLLELPIAEKVKEYNEPHWFPILITKN